MNFTEVFPEDPTDPTVKKDREKMTVNETLGAMGHIKASTRSRKWRFMTGQDVTEEKIRAAYDLPETAQVVRRGVEWAVWSGDGEPTSDPFEGQDTITVPSPAPDDGLGQLIAAGVSPEAVKAVFGATSTSEILESRKMYGQENDVWAYSSNVDGALQLRKRYERPDAPIAEHPTGGIYAIWLGDGPPTRPAFPGAAVKSSVKPEPVKSATIPENALHDAGLKLYKMSCDPVFSVDEQLRRKLLQMSDILHAEAARFEVARIRAALENK
jgi:hypothetical protein